MKVEVGLDKRVNVTVNDGNIYTDVHATDLRQGIFIEERDNHITFGLMEFAKSDKITTYSDNILHEHEQKMITVEANGDIFVDNGERTNPRDSNVSHFGSRRGQMCYIDSDLFDEIGIPEDSGFNIRIVDNKLILWIGEWTDIKTDLENTRLKIE